MALPSDFTLLQVVPELETGGAEQSALDVARAVVAAGGRAIVASRGGRMAARLESVGGELAPIRANSKNPLVIYANSRRLAALIRDELNQEVSIRTLFVARTVTGLSGMWQDLARSSRPALRRRTKDGELL